MNKLLKRLITRYLPSHIDQQELQKFLFATSEALENNDMDREMSERSIRLVSEELMDINERLRKNLAENKTYQLQLEEFVVKQQSLIETSPEGIFSFIPGGRLDQINSSACAMLNLSKEEAMELSAEEVLGIFLSKLLDPEKFMEDIARIHKDSSLKLKGLIKTKNGEHFEYISHPEILNGTYIGRVWCYHDITDLKNKQELLHYRAYHDSLTGLPNRSNLLDKLNKIISNAEEKSSNVAVLFIDLDNFKKINDTGGHAHGDRYLIEVGRSFESKVVKNGTLGRLGGDEFLMIIDGFDDVDEIESICRDLLSSFDTFIMLGDLKYTLSASIGISLFSKDGLSPEELIRKADIAMYQAKQKGKNTYFFYDSCLEQEILHRLSIEHQLREAIQKDQLELYYQPKIDLKTGSLQGVEALVRWVLPDGEIIYPDRFIPVAEATGLIRHITRWVISTACQKIKTWEKTALFGVSVSVNISAVDFSDRAFLNEATDLIEKYEIGPQQLDFELTESAFFEDINWVKKTINTLRAKGITWSIDDFGVGYSSFAYLQEMDIDYLKIDRSFVQGMQKSQRSLSIVKSMIDIGVNLGMKVVAEGIENDDEQQILLDAGCHYGQGYYYSRPITENELLAYAFHNNAKINTEGIRLN